jgi:LAO/AO transport system kinase
MSRPVDPEGLAAGVREGRDRAVARTLTLVEDGHPALPALLARLGPAPDGLVAGITGAPGAGKSTFTSALIGRLRSRGDRVAVLAVDPSSPLTGGALLGDRIRMQEHALDEGVFIRSMASRGRLGGLARAVPQAVRVLLSAGYGAVLVETVGVGQSEVDVARLADSTLVLLAPGSGDAVQTAKAGLLEVADVLVVTKSDLPGADVLAGDLRRSVRLGGAAPGGWAPPVVPTAATSGAGIPEALAALDAHRAWASAGGELAARRLRRAAGEIEAVLVDAVRARLGVLPYARHLQELAARVRDGGLDPWSAAEALLGRADPGQG